MNFKKKARQGNFKNPQTNPLNLEGRKEVRKGGRKSKTTKEEEQGKGRPSVIG